jgi:hypothetical protein
MARKTETYRANRVGKKVKAALPHAFDRKTRRGIERTAARRAVGQWDGIAAR